jgi:hypothetical protein
MRREREGRHVGLGHGQAQLFLQFTRERALRAFTGFHLAARELPETSHRFSHWPLRKQQPSIVSHQRGRSDEHQRYRTLPLCHDEVSIRLRRLDQLL